MGALSRGAPSLCARGNGLLFPSSLVSTVHYTFYWQACQVKTCLLYTSCAVIALYSNRKGKHFLHTNHCRLREGRNRRAHNIFSRVSIACVPLGVKAHENAFRVNERYLRHRLANDLFNLHLGIGLTMALLLALVLLEMCIRDRSKALRPVTFVKMAESIYVAPVL